MQTLAPFVGQAFLFHLAAARHLGPDPGGRMRLAAEFLAAGCPLVITAAIGVRRALTGREPVERILVAWLAAACAVVLGLTPLWPHHLAILLSPLSLLAGGPLNLLVDRAAVAARGAVTGARLAGAVAYICAGASLSGLPASAPDLREASRS